MLPGALDGGRSPDRDLEQLHPEAGSSECDADLHCLEPVPQRGAPVRLDHLLSQSEPRVTTPGAFASHLAYIPLDGSLVVRPR